MIKIDKNLTLGVLREYIIKFYPELKWWDGYHKHEEFNKSRSYKHRAGMPNEIRIEFDGNDHQENFKNSNLTAVKLYDLGYSFAVFHVEGGRSPHIHIYDLDELNQLTEQQRTEYRSKFLKKICPKNSNPDISLCDEKHLCALEFVNHFKYNKPKKLLNYFLNGRNMGIDFDIKIEVMFSEKKIITKKNIKFGDMIFNKNRDIIMNSCEFEKIFDKYKISYKGHMAQCPFHNDTNFSLSFSNKKALWKCFGCDTNGNVFTLIKMLRGNK